MLLFIKADCRERLAWGKVRQRRIQLFLFVVTALFINGSKAENFMLWWVARKTWFPQAASIAVTSYSAFVICDAMNRLQISL